MGLRMTRVDTRPEPSAVFVSNLFPNNMESARGIYNARQLTALRACGWHFTVVAPVSFFPLHKSRFAPRARDVSAEEQVDGMRVFHPRALYLPLARGALNARLYEWSVGSCVQRACQELRASLVWSSFAFPDGVAAGRISRRLGRPHIASALGSDIHQGLQVRGRCRVLLAEMGAARLVLAKSRALRDRLVSAGVPGDRVAIDYNGVDRSLFHSRPRSDACRKLGASIERRRILFVGGFVPVKNVPLLLEATAHLSPALCEELDLVLVGDGHLRRQITALAQHLGIASRTVFLGQRPPAEVALWMNASDVLCLPSLHEGVPNVVLEALSSGCPVVASRVGGVPEVHPGPTAGALFEVGDAEALTRALTEVLGRSWEREGIARTMEGWSWENNACRVDALLRVALGQPE